MIASVDKGTHACGPDWAAVCRVIVLDIRQYVCVLCLADNAPDQPASPSEFFTEDKRRLARQTRQAGCRPPTRITTPDVVLPREKPCVPLSTDAILTAYSGQEALKKVAYKPDLILLDINMPGMDGLTVCQKIREHIACPILFLTARIESSDKIIGFQAGADDYIVKPFDLDELGARIAAHLRREQRRQNNSAVRFFGELILDYSARTVTINNQNIPLSKREFEIVELLSLNAGQVFDRERIYERVWGLDGDGNSDTIMEHIRKIRAKFAAHTLHNYIETVWGCGYRWNA